MTFRTHVLAGLITAALGAPAFAHATAPNIGIGERQQRAETGASATGAGAQDTRSSEQFALKHKQAMDRGATHQDANAQAAAGLATPSDPSAARGWSLRHKEAMDEGASHTDANFLAGHL